MRNRTLVNASKQVSRSGWIAWSSIAVMALAFFVGSVFAGIAYAAHLKIQSIETRDNMLVFFEVGTDPQLIQRLRSKWEVLPEIKSISFTKEEDAYTLYFAETLITDPTQNQLLAQMEVKRLDSSLDIRLNNLDDLPNMRALLKSDIDNELRNLSFNPNRPPIDLKVDDRSLDEARDVFLVVRISGIVLLALLFIIIFFFILMTVEYRTYNRMEEIGVMQLVGGSLSYIRAPFIAEGAFYGGLGALISALTIGVIAIFIFVINGSSTVAVQFYEELHALNLPYISFFGWLGLILVNVIVGAVLGAVISYLAIRRYIK